jgi:uncharacterized protein YceK
MERKMALIALTIIGIMTVSGCISIEGKNIDKIGSQERYINYKYNDYIDIYTVCDDKVVCYKYAQSISGGIDCFRDEDLVEKYCGD